MSISSTIDERYRKQYFVAFILITLLVWSPLKAVANIAPYIFVVATIFLFRGKVFKINRILINRLIGFVLGFVLILTTYWLLYPGEFLFFNAFFSLITYSLVIVLLCIPSKGLGDPRLLYKMAAYTFPFVFLESIIGLVQAVYGFFITGTFDGVNGDHVEGTIHLPLHSSLSFSNPLFTLNLIASIIFVIYVGKFSKKTRWIAISACGFVTVLLASVMHLTFMIILAWILNLVSNTKIKFKFNVKNAVVVGSLILTIVIGLTSLQGGNMLLIEGYYIQLVEYKFVKYRTLENFFVKMPEQSLIPMIFGTGPGQFASKASLLLSSNYIEGGFFGTFPTREITELNFIGPYNASPTRAVSALLKPYFSMFSIITEFGIIGLIIVFVLFRRFMKKVKAMKAHNKTLASTVIILSYFVFFTGFLEFYWETPHGLILPIVMMKPIYAYLKDQHEKSIAT